MRKILLASTSPRRIEIFKKTGLTFKTTSPRYEEDNSLPLPPRQLVKYLATQKALSVAKDCRGEIVIAADTLVSYKNKVYGKPKSKKEALDVLRRLNGKEHQIVSGYCIIDTKTNCEFSGAVTTNIVFRNHSLEFLKDYVKSVDVTCYAGGYDHEGLGILLVESIKGDFYNSIGLPVLAIVDKLMKLDVDFL